MKSALRYNSAYVQNRNSAKIQTRSFKYCYSIPDPDKSYTAPGAKK